MTFKRIIDREKAYDLYVNQNLEAREVAKILGCTDKGIRTLAHRERWIKLPKPRIDIDRDLLYDLYIIQNLSKDEVAEKLGLSSHVVKRRLQEYGMKKNAEAHVEAIRKACMKKYNLPNGGWSLQAQEKIKKTNLARYGSTSYLQCDDYKVKNEETLKKRGVTNVFQLEDVKEKSKQTNLRKYGVEYNMQNKEIATRSANKIRMNWANKTKEELERLSKVYSDAVKKSVWKINETKHKNNSFNTSQPEQEIKKLLEHRFPDTKYQYSSDVYPFLCDFYIPQLDLYIEYQGTWTHGGEPFVGTEEQLIKLREWEDRASCSEYYNNAIHVWTVMDPEKRRVVEENNLNWLEFFNIDEFFEWFESF